MDIDRIQEGIFIEAKPEVVWEQLTDPQAMKGWWKGLTRFDAETGGTFEAHSDDWDFEGNIITMETNFLLNMTRKVPGLDGETIIRIQLTGFKGGTELKVSEMGFDSVGDKGIDLRDFCVSTWKYAFGTLKEQCERVIR